MYLLKRLFLIALLTLAGLSIYMMLFEEKFIYFPGSELSGTPANYGMPFEQLQVSTADGVKLHGWQMPVPESRFTVLHFHGNAGNISHRLSLYRKWQSMGLSVYAFDYRGYGKSEGKPDEAGLYEDARAVWKDVTHRLGVKPEQVILAGRSLGAAVAAKLATEVKAAGVVLETPFTNIPDMAACHYPWLPLRWLTKSRFDTKNMVKEIHLPLLVIGASEDRIAPVWMAEDIFSTANALKVKIELSGGHNNFDQISSHAYTAAWQQWISALQHP